MNKLMNFFCNNADVLTAVHEFDNRMSFQEFNQDRLSKKVIRKLKRYREYDYVRSPEDSLIDQDDLTDITYAFLQL